MAILPWKIILSFFPLFFTFVTPSSMTKRENDPILIDAGSSPSVVPPNCQDVNGAPNASCWDALAVQPYYEKYQKNCDPANRSRGGICFCSEKLAWSTCYLAGAELSACGISLCKNSQGKAVQYSCLDLAKTDDGCTAPKYTGALTGSRARVYFASAAIVG